MLTPTRSAGSRSGVNWTRFHEQSIEAASALARLVLPTPGTSSIKRCPSASRDMTASSIGSILPWTTCAMLAVMASNSDAKREDWPSAAGTSLLRARLDETVTAVKGRRASAPIPCRRNQCGRRRRWSARRAESGLHLTTTRSPYQCGRRSAWRRRRAESGLHLTTTRSPVSHAAGEGAGAPAVPIRVFTSR